MTEFHSPLWLSKTSLCVCKCMPLCMCMQMYALACTAFSLPILLSRLHRSAAVNREAGSKCVHLFLCYLVGLSSVFFCEMGFQRCNYWSKDLQMGVTSEQPSLHSSHFPSPLPTGHRFIFLFSLQSPGTLACCLPFSVGS